MSRVFVDTDVLAYRFDVGDPVKHDLAAAALLGRDSSSAPMPPSCRGRP